MGSNPTRGTDVFVRFLFVSCRYRPYVGLISLLRIPTECVYHYAEKPPIPDNGL
jgi:hypothetical protein